jgi:hypothetical protein
MDAALTPLISITDQLEPGVLSFSRDDAIREEPHHFSPTEPGLSTPLGLDLGVKSEPERLLTEQPLFTLSDRLTVAAEVASADLICTHLGRGGRSALRTPRNGDAREPRGQRTIPPAPGAVSGTAPPGKRHPDHKRSANSPKFMLLYPKFSRGRPLKNEKDVNEKVANLRCLSLVFCRPSQSHKGFPQKEIE